MPKSSEALVPYLDYREHQLGGEEALVLAAELANRPSTTAPMLVEIAKFHYLRRLLSTGDALIEQAKALDPSCARIYDEEAWNQRARGNVHREIGAVQRSIELASTDEERLFWRGWLANALVRQGQIELAWAELETFPDLPAGDERLLTLAYCANRLGHLDRAEAAYVAYAPAAPGASYTARAFDLLAVAQSQFEIFQRADEASALLKDLGDADATALYALSATTQLHSGDIETALAHARVAAQRSDATPRSRAHLGQLFELLGRQAEALSAYEAISPSTHTELSRLRLAELRLRADGTGATSAESARRAVTGYFDGFEVPSLSEATLGTEVDPALPVLLAKLARNENRASLEDAERRVSEPELQHVLSLRLAVAFAAEARWNDAMDAIRRAHLDRLPAVELTLRAWSDLGSPLGIFYDECTVTEPLATDTVLYESSLGATTSCNPLAMCLELMRDPARAHLTHVWSVNPGVTIHPSLLGQPNVVFVRKGSAGHMRALASAGYVVNNSTLEYEFTKRPGQRYLNTWHGVPWKTMGRDNKSEPFSHGNIARNFLHADVVIGPDPHTLDVLSRGHDVAGLIPEVFVQAGYPRNDLALNLSPIQRESMRDRLGVNTGENLVLFMPTWQGTFAERDASVQSVVDTARGLAAPGLKIAVRAHHYVSAAFAGAQAPADFVFVPAEFDTNELMGAADAVVTDFSSVLFDAAAVGVPVVKLTAGADEYEAERGLYYSPDDVPGANAATLDEARRLLLDAVQDREGFVSEYSEQTERFSFNEQGTSAKRAVALLLGEEAASPAPQPGADKSLLLSTGGLPPNGITRSARSLIVALQGTGYAPYLFPDRNALEGAEPGTLADLREYAHVLPLVGTPGGTRMEREVLQYFSSRRFVETPLVRGFVRSGRIREARRLFASTEFFSAVEFSAYDPNYIALISEGVTVSGGRRGIIFHNEMWKEVENKYPRLRAGFLSMDSLDFLASVSDGVRDYNAETMFEHLNVPREKHITIENTINVAEIRALAELPLEPEDLDWYASEGAHAGVIARMSHEKNHAALFTALADCRDQLSRPVRLTCMGDGPLRLELERQLSDLGLTDLVRLRGLVPNPQAHLGAAGAMILPSLHEGQPLVILEALTVGAPVVATDTPGSRSVLHDGDFGVLVPISHEGLVEALHRVADGRLTGNVEFDAETYTQQSLNMFLDAVNPKP